MKRKNFFCTAAVVAFVTMGFMDISHAQEFGSFMDSRDGQTYKTVKIGDQVWMAENLNYDYNKGTAKSYCYEYSADSCAKYGRLYEWGAAMDSAAVFSENGAGCGYGTTCSPTYYPVRGVCPEGWHLPDSLEWKTLYNYVDANNGNEDVWNRLKSTSGRDWFGFLAQPAGTSSIPNNYLAFWSASETGENFARSRFLVADNEKLGGFYDFKKISAISVRCVQNSENVEIKHKNSSGEKKQQQENSKKGSSFTDSRDGQTYKTVKIGDQVWMAQNLNYDYNKGTAKSYCYGNSADNCAKYGRLYTWAAAMDSAAVFSTKGKGCGYGTTCSPTYPVRGVCPEGWHLPTDNEWTTLAAYVDANNGSEGVGRSLKSISGWDGDAYGFKGTDKFGFSALPAGIFGHRFFKVGRTTRFWSATENNGINVRSRVLSIGDGGFFAYNVSKYGAYSVRCVQDSK